MVAVNYSCQSDDDATPTTTITPETDESVDLTATINAITGGSDKTWKIESAVLVNSNQEDVNISTLFNVKDDEFIFSTDTDTSIRLRHRRGYRIDSSAQNIQSVKSDVRVAPIETTLNSENTTEFLFADLGRYMIDYNESDQTITGVYTYGNGASLSIVLTKKVAVDYVVPPTTIPSLSEVFRFEASQPVLDMKYSFTTESLYMASRKQTDEQQLIKYAIADGSSVSQITTGGDYVAQQLAFIDDQVVTISSNEVSKSNLDLSGNAQTTTLSTSVGEFDYRTVAIENQIYKIGGHNGLGLDAISILNGSDTSFSQVLAMAEEKTSVGAEIIDNELYVIGGFKFSDQGEIITYDEMVMYDLENNMSAQVIALPANLTRTFTARYENLLYIAGRKYNGSGQAITNYLTVYNTLDNSFQEIDITGMLPHTMIMREMTVSNSKIYFAIQVLESFDPFEISILEGSLN
jgi:hypothetical protein